MEILIKENLQSKLKELIEKWGRVDELDYFKDTKKPLNFF